MASKYYSIGILQLFLGTFMILGLAGCGKGDGKSSTPKKVAQDTAKFSKADSNFQLKDVQGTWLVESLSVKDKTVYQIEKGMQIGTVSEVFGIDGDKDSKIMMVFEMDTTDISVKVYKNGVLNSKVEGTFKINKNKIVIAYEDKKTSEIQVRRSGDNRILIDKDKSYSLVPISEKQLLKLIKKQSGGQEIKLSELKETPDQA